MPLSENSVQTIARRAASEVFPGAVVAVDRGLPEMVAHAVPAMLGAKFLRPDGTLDGVPLSASDAAAVVRGGYVDLAFIHPGRVMSDGSFVNRPHDGDGGPAHPGNAVDLASSARRVIALQPQMDDYGSVICLDAADSDAEKDGVACVDTVITDAAVFKIEGSRFVLTELASGNTVDSVMDRVLDGAVVSVSHDVGEMDLTLPTDSPVSKIFSDGSSALHDLHDGATVFIDGFGGPGGMAHYLLISLRDRGSRDLTIVSNTAGIARVVSFGTPPGRTAIDHSVLIENGQVAKAIASFPVSPSVSRPSEFELAYRRGDVDLELVPQGTLAERLRAGGAGMHAFYTPTGAGTLIAEGKEGRTINGREHILEFGLRADFAIIRAHKADANGNLVYRGTSRNFNAVMAPAARVTVVEVDEIVEADLLN